MTRRTGDLLAQRASETFVGRAGERATLLQALDEEGPSVLFVQGIGGMGKSRLLEAFAGEARARGASVIRLDCRVIEPTERGFLQALGAASGGETPSVEEAARRLGRLGSRVVLALDTYEVFRLMDTWLRQVFIPALEDHVRVVLCGREPPLSAWLTASGWQGLFRSVRLEPLSEVEALDLLARAGIPPEQGQQINRFARGHPLALTLAAAAMRERHIPGLEEGVVQYVVQALTRTYLAGIDDPLTAAALDAASVVRCTTIPLLAAMLPNAAPQDLYDRLRALPFVESHADGLHLHDMVQEAVAAVFKAADPGRYREYRRGAWRQLRTEVRAAARPDLWRCTADMLYIIENPVLREAFFPSGAPAYAVEPARPADGAAIRAMAERHEGPAAARCLDFWWNRAPQSFSAVRGPSGEVQGFYCMFDPAQVDRRLLQEDPIVAAWCTHLREDPVPKGQQALFIRRWLSAEHGEAASPVQAACWLDIKRSYMERRPYLRRIYLTVHDLVPYAPVAQTLGFQHLARFAVEMDGRQYHSAVLDMGPASVDGWLTGLVAAELGIEQDDLLDSQARELVFDGRRVPLTRLEFAVLAYLQQREGRAVDRAALLQDVWGYAYDGGSNVVDAVVRSVRRKLGPRASVIRTISGVGYMLRR